MENECEICGTFFKVINQNRNKERTHSEQLEKNLDIKENFLCERCITILKNNEHIKSNRKIDVETSKGKITINVKKKNQNFFINLHNKDYRYSLFSENFNNYLKTTIKFYQYKKMLEKNEFKIIRNIESLDDNYRRIYSRVKFGLLFDD